MFASVIIPVNYHCYCLINALALLIFSVMLLLAYATSITSQLCTCMHIVFITWYMYRANSNSVQYLVLVSYKTEQQMSN